MTIYDYKVVPAPAKGDKVRGLKGPETRLARTFETVLNDMAGDGWEFQRAETLPSEERQGLTHSATTFRTFLVFRRPRPDDISAFEPRQVDTAGSAPAGETEAGGTDGPTEEEDGDATR